MSDIGGVEGSLAETPNRPAGPAAASAGAAPTANRVAPVIASVASRVARGFGTETSLWADDERDRAQLIVEGTPSAWMIRNAQSMRRTRVDAGGWLPVLCRCVFRRSQPTFRIERTPQKRYGVPSGS